MFFDASTWTLVVILTLVIGAFVAGGLLLGRALHDDRDRRRESINVVQGTLLGFLGLLLAFGLSMAVGRYDARRSLVVQEANDIGTTALRAELLAEQERGASLDLLREYGDAAVELATSVPGTRRFDEANTHMEELQTELWALAGDATRADPTGTAPRLYVESLNATIDSHSSRVASLSNRVPTTVMALQVFGSAVALGVLALYLMLLGRAALPAVVAAAVVILILFISFDLDRPQRGMIRVPATPLIDARAAMDGSADGKS